MEHSLHWIGTRVLLMGLVLRHVPFKYINGTGQNRMFLL